MFLLEQELYASKMCSPCLRTGVYDLSGLYTFATCSLYKLVLQPIDEFVDTLI